MSIMNLHVNDKARNNIHIHTYTNTQHTCMHTHTNIMRTCYTETHRERDEIPLFLTTFPGPTRYKLRGKIVNNFKTTAAEH